MIDLLKNSLRILRKERTPFGIIRVQIKRNKSYNAMKQKGKVLKSICLIWCLGFNSFKQPTSCGKIDDLKKTWIEWYLNDFEPNFVYSDDCGEYEVIAEKIHKRYYEAPKLISDVFEAILGAIFVDGGYNEVVRVLQHILGPLVIMVAKFFDKIRKNPVEQFNLFWSKYFTVFFISNIIFLLNIKINNKLKYIKIGVSKKLW